MTNNIALYAFEKFGDDILRAAYTYIHNLSEAEDLTQEVFLKLHVNPQFFNSDEHLKAWLLRCIYNRCKNYLTSYRIRKITSIEEVNELTLIQDFSENDNMVLNSLNTIPQKYRSVIFLYYYEGYKIKEIAEILEKNENTISSLLRRGREKLKIQLEEE